MLLQRRQDSFRKTNQRFLGPVDVIEGADAGGDQIFPCRRIKIGDQEMDDGTPQFRSVLARLL